MKIMHILSAALVLPLALMATQVMAGDPRAGEAKAQACIACHGADGNSTTTAFPRIGGQYESFLLRTLRGYKSGERQNAIMAGTVAGLSDQDLQDLAAYYAGQDSALYVPALR
ncbi:MAG: cytochrome c [Thioalkalivibrio sp.]